MSQCLPGVRITCSCELMSLSREAELIRREPPCWMPLCQHSLCSCSCLILWEEVKLRVRTLGMSSVALDKPCDLSEPQLTHLRSRNSSGPVPTSWGACHDACRPRHVSPHADGAQWFQPRLYEFLSQRSGLQRVSGLTQFNYPPHRHHLTVAGTGFSRAKASAGSRVFPHPGSGLPGVCLGWSAAGADRAAASASSPCPCPLSTPSRWTTGSVPTWRVPPSSSSSSALSR